MKQYMKKKKIILSGAILFILGILFVIIVQYDKREYVMYDGTMLALTIDGVPSNSFPDDSGKYYVDISCTGGTGQYLPDENGEMKFMINDIKTEGVTCDINFTTITESNKSDYLASKIVKSNTTEVTSTNDNGGTDISYRYTGKNPNNYVWFNNELWRIIGLIPVCLEASCGTPTTSLVKIIRSESIGGLNYDWNYDSCVWSKVSLNTLLNTYYYGKQNATGTTECDESVCDYTKSGISSDANDFYGKMIKEVYWNSGWDNYATDYTPGGIYTGETSTQSALGYVGLMGASDYGYAAGSEWYNTSLLSFSGMPSVNWLYGQGEEWVLFRSDTPSEFYINLNGYLADVSNQKLSVRPTVYLNSNVYITGGSGTTTDPYILGM